MKKLSLYPLLLLLLTTKFAFGAGESCTSAIRMCADRYQYGRFTNQLPLSTTNVGSTVSAFTATDKIIWFTFIAQSDGEVQVNLIPDNASDHFYLALYDHCPLASSALHSETVLVGEINSPSFTAEAGEQFWIVIGHDDGATPSSFTLDLSGSTSEVYDYKKPVIISATTLDPTLDQTPASGQANTLSSIIVTFSEPVKASTIGQLDFKVTSREGGQEMNVSISVGSGDYVSQVTIGLDTMKINTPVGVYVELRGEVMDMCGELSNKGKVHVQVPLPTSDGQIQFSQPNGDCLTYKLEITGITGHSYQWYKDGIPIPNTDVIELTDITEPGAYSARVIEDPNVFNAYEVLGTIIIQ